MEHSGLHKQKLKQIKSIMGKKFLDILIKNMF